MAEEHQQDRPGRSSNQAIFDRIGRVEGDVSELRALVAGVTTNLEHQGQTLTRIAMTLEQRSATDWKAIWSAASVVLALIALAATLVLSPIRQQIDANRVAIGDLAAREVVKQRAELQDARDAIRQAEEQGRYKERVDRIDRELEQMHLDQRARMRGQLPGD